MNKQDFHTNTNTDTDMADTNFYFSNMPVSVSDLSVQWWSMVVEGDQGWWREYFKFALNILKIYQGLSIKKTLEAKGGGAEFQKMSRILIEV